MRYVLFVRGDKEDEEALELLRDVLGDELVVVNIQSRGWLLWEYGSDETPILVTPTEVYYGLEAIRAFIRGFTPSVRGAVSPRVNAEPSVKEEEKPLLVVAIREDLSLFEWELAVDEVRRAVRKLLRKQRGSFVLLTPERVARLLGSVEFQVVCHVLEKLDYLEGWVAVHLSLANRNAVLMVREDKLAVFFEIFNGKLVIRRDPADECGEYDGWLWDTPLVRWTLFLSGLKCKVTPKARSPEGLRV
mgnify:CR=1 FL=1